MSREDVRYPRNIRLRRLLTRLRDRLVVEEASSRSKSRLETPLVLDGPRRVSRLLQEAQREDAISTGPLLGKYHLGKKGRKGREENIFRAERSPARAKIAGHVESTLGDRQRRIPRIRLEAERIFHSELGCTIIRVFEMEI